MNSSIQQMREDLLGLGLTKGTIRVYCHCATKFMKEVEGTPDRHDALRFLGVLRENSKPNSRRVMYYAIRALFRSMDQDFNVPPPKENMRGEISRPILTGAQVESLIEWVKEDGTPCQKAYLALSTVFGLRRSELIGIRQGDIDAGTIMIWTAKGGDPKRHVIPDPIAGAIYGYEDWGSLSETAGSIVFKAILLKAGLGLMRGYGWHSIRRALVTELIRRGVDSLVAKKFMRWHGTMNPIDPLGMLAMPSIYVQFEDRELDEMVFESHPFLEAWES